MIRKDSSKAAHLFIALPAASLASSVAFNLFLLIGNLEKVSRNSIGDLIMFPLTLLGVACLMLFFIVPVGTVAYVILKATNQLKLSVFTFIGVICSLIVSALSWSEVQNGAWIQTIWFLIIGISASTMSYWVLRRLASSTHNIRLNPDSSAAGYRNVEAVD